MVELQKEESQELRIRDETFDFKDIPAGSLVYGIHPYPAMFHFMVVRRLLLEFSKEGDIVLDPFMGSGVCAVECLVNGRNFVGYDINPLALLIAKVRTTPIGQKEILNNLVEILDKSKHRESVEIPNFPNIEYWFSEKSIIGLSKLKRTIFELKDERLKDFFKVAFSETVRRVSKTDHNEFKILRKKDKKERDVFSVFKEISLRNSGLLFSFYEKFKPKDVKLSFECRNILEEIPLEDESVDLVITSPPYGDSKTTVAYGQFSRLSLNWLGIQEDVDKRSLGSNKRDLSYLPSKILYELADKISKVDDKRAKEILFFYSDLFSSIEIIARKVKRGGFVCFVVGNRRVKGVELETDRISVDFFSHFGFKHIKTIIRKISNKRMPLQNSPSNVKGGKDLTMRYEYIVILRKII